MLIYNPCIFITAFNAGVYANIKCSIYKLTINTYVNLIQIISDPINKFINEYSSDNATGR